MPKKATLIYDITHGVVYITRLSINVKIYYSSSIKKCLGSG